MFSNDLEFGSFAFPPLPCTRFDTDSVEKRKRQLGKVDTDFK